MEPPFDGSIFLIYRNCICSLHTCSHRMLCHYGNWMQVPPECWTVSKNPDHRSGNRSFQRGSECWCLPVSGSFQFTSSKQFTVSGNAYDVPNRQNLFTHQAMQRALQLCILCNIRDSAIGIKPFRIFHRNIRSDTNPMNILAQRCVIAG